jgi:hypothetical protein
MRKGVDFYKTCALLFFNTLVLFVIANAIVYVAYAIKDRLYGRPGKSAWVLSTVGMPFLKAVHPGYKDDDIRLLMKETWDRKLEYDPFLQFRERAHAGKLVNIDRTGFRLSKNNGPWPPDSRNVNIFMFGGSGTFGYGIADDETIASHLQVYCAGRSAREVKVYNFGSGWFFSTQERTRFLNLLAEGFAPDVAIFIDGLNDFYYETGEPEFTNVFRQFMDGGAVTRADSSDGLFAQFPISRFFDSLRSRTSLNRHQRPQPSHPLHDPSKNLAEIVNRYLQNKRLIEAGAVAYHVRPVFVWQPAPSYHYDMEQYLGRNSSAKVPPTIKLGYDLMARTVKENPKDFAGDFLWLADIQENSTGHLYVDMSHYTDKFCNVIAGHIGRFLVERQIVALGNVGHPGVSSNLASTARRDGR